MKPLKYLVMSVVVGAVGYGLGVNWQFRDRGVGEYLGQMPPIQNGRQSGILLTYDTEAVMPDGHRVDTPLRTWFFSDGSFIKEMPLGVTLFDANQIKYYFFDSQSHRLRKITSVEQHVPQLQEVDPIPCRVGNRETKCLGWNQELVVPPGGRFGRKIFSLEHSMVIPNDRVNRVRLANQYLFGKEAWQARGVIYSGEVYSPLGELVFSAKLSSAESFSGKESVESVVSRLGLSGTCRFFPYYDCK